MPEVSYTMSCHVLLHTTCSNHQKISWEFPIGTLKLFLTYEHRDGLLPTETLYHAAVETNNGTEAFQVQVPTQTKA